MASVSNKRNWKKSIFSQATKEVGKCDNTVEVPKKKPKCEPKIPDTDTLKSSDVPRNFANNTNWMEFFEPKSIEDLALHAKKLAELQQWFLECCSPLSAASSSSEGYKSTNSARLCLITGPSGSGKTAAVRVLAQTYEFYLQEWINPVDQEVVNNLGDQLLGERYLVSNITNFKHFLFQASRYKSLFENSDKRLLLVEDFPNAFINNKGAGFEEILSEYMDYGKSPLVFIASDSKSRNLNINYNLFPDEIKQKYNITHISFNPIAITLMQKAMKRFSTLMQTRYKNGVNDYCIPSQQTVDSIILSAQGDIRNALLNFHFAALKGAPELLVSEAVAQLTTNKTRSKKQTNLKAVGRDESVTMLHSLGRVFNPKYMKNGMFSHSPEDIAEAFSTEPKKFLDFLHANYLVHFSEIEHVNAATNSLSIADVMLQEYRSDAQGTIGLNVATRGLMIANCKPVHKWLPIRGPKRFTPGEKMHHFPNLKIRGISNNLFAVDYSSFVSTIASTKSSEK